MTTPNSLPDPVQPEPDEIVAEGPLTVSFPAIQAAKAEILQDAKDTKASVWSRTWRTLGQGIVSAAGLAAVSAVYEATNSGQTDPKTILFLAASAVLTAVVTYLHNKVAPPK
jgi:FtsH-binding integral membrane protein